MVVVSVLEGRRLSCSILARRARLLLTHVYQVIGRCGRCAKGGKSTAAAIHRLAQRSKLSGVHVCNRLGCNALEVWSGKSKHVDRSSLPHPSWHGGAHVPKHKPWPHERQIKTRVDGAAQPEPRRCISTQGCEANAGIGSLPEERPSLCAAHCVAASRPLAVSRPRLRRCGWRPCSLSSKPVAPSVASVPPDHAAHAFCNVPAGCDFQVCLSKSWSPEPGL